MEYSHREGGIQEENRPIYHGTLKLVSVADTKNDDPKFRSFLTLLIICKCKRSYLRITKLSGE